MASCNFEIGGQTSLSVRLENDRFDSRRRAIIGADYRVFDLKFDEMPVSLSVQLWVLSIQDRFWSMTGSHLRDADLAIVLCDMTSDASFNTMDWLLDWLQESAPGVKAIVVANKQDLVLDTRAFSIKANALVKRHFGVAVGWIPISCKTGFNMDKLRRCLAACLVSQKFSGGHLQQTRKAALLLVMARKFQGNNGLSKLPKEIVLKIAKMVWEDRFDLGVEFNVDLTFNAQDFVCVA